MAKQISNPSKAQVSDETAPTDFDSVIASVGKLDGDASDVILAINRLLTPPRYAESESGPSVTLDDSQRHFLRRLETILVDARHSLLGTEQGHRQRSGGFLGELAKGHRGGFRAHK